MKGELPARADADEDEFAMAAALQPVEDAAHIDDQGGIRRVVVAAVRRRIAVADAADIEAEGGEADRRQSPGHRDRHAAHADMVIGAGVDEDQRGPCRRHGMGRAEDTERGWVVTENRRDLVRIRQRENRGESNFGRTSRRRARACGEPVDQPAEAVIGIAGMARIAQEQRIILEDALLELDTRLPDTGAEFLVRRGIRPIQQ